MFFPDFVARESGNIASLIAHTGFFPVADEAVFDLRMFAVTHRIEKRNRYGGTGGRMTSKFPDVCGGHKFRAFRFFVGSVPDLDAQGIVREEMESERCIDPYLAGITLPAAEIASVCRIFLTQEGLGKPDFRKQPEDRGVSLSHRIRGSDSREPPPPLRPPAKSIPPLSVLHSSFFFPFFPDFNTIRKSDE